MGNAILLVPRTAGFTALGPTVIMAGAALTHVFVLPDGGWVLPPASTAAMAAVDGSTPRDGTVDRPVQSSMRSSIAVVRPRAR